MSQIFVDADVQARWDAWQARSLDQDRSRRRRVSLFSWIAVIALAIFAFTSFAG